MLLIYIRAKGNVMKNTKNPQISVIITVRNEEKTIKSCLESVINQSISNDLYEILVIDGNSKDRTTEIVTEVSKKYPMQISLFDQEGKGISNARNTGIKYSHGKILSFIDGDAIACENWLDEYLQCFDQNGDDLGFAWGPIKLWNNEKIVAKILYNFFYSQIGAQGVNIAFRKSALYKVGNFDEQFIGRGDEVVVILKLVKSGFKSRKCDKAIVSHELPTSIAAFFKLRYYDGYHGYTIAQKYYNLTEKRKYFISFILKFMILIGIIALAISVVYWTAFSLIALIILLIGVIEVYLNISKPKNKTISLILAGLPIILLGHTFQLCGEFVRIVKLK
jgi:glycosyltransferase involved in cell wall biosynthesis